MRKTERENNRVRSSTREKKCVKKKKVKPKMGGEKYDRKKIYEERSDIQTEKLERQS